MFPCLALGQLRFCGFGHGGGTAAGL